MFQDYKFESIWGFIKQAIFISSTFSTQNINFYIKLHFNRKQLKRNGILLRVTFGKRQRFIRFVNFDLSLDN